MTNGTGRAINVREPSIEAATVEVATLQINGKHMPLSVFRQLIEEPVVDVTTGGYFGEMWGTVNYHTPNECLALYGPGEHYHVVWKKGDELRRSVVYLSHLEYKMPRHGLFRADILGVWERLAGLPQLFIGV
jgi:hypothetical protein